MSDPIDMEFKKLQDRIDELERWKAEGLSVLDDWERLVYAKVEPRTDQLGLTHAAVVADRIDELETALADAEEHRVKHLLRIDELETALRTARHHDLCNCYGCQRITEALDE